ncbi:MAG: DUF3489 domain-containing protein [Proteobacteria bacterium]|nr:DUF3489 domain-containing protein [Pseudomonadota bacterium]
MGKSPKRRSVRKTAKAKTTQSLKRNTAAPSKIDQIIAALRAPKGATIAALTALTGWQTHSVRGALAGAVKKRGLCVSSTKADGERVYRIGGKP